MTTYEQLARRALLAGRLMRRPSRRAARRQDVGLRLVWKAVGVLDGTRTQFSTCDPEIPVAEL